MKQLSKWSVLAKPFRSSDCDYGEYCKMAPRLCARSIVVALALLFCFAIYGRPPSRAGAGAQSWQVVDLGTFLSYSPFVILLFYLPQKTLRLSASAGDSIVGCLLVCGCVWGKLFSSLPKSQNMTCGSIVGTR
jgi:hypothetical protein